MLSIGEFARLAGVSVRMLRHYDQLGLLRPQRVDAASGYRSYAASQLDRANRLIALKDLGFTLDQVGRLLDDGLSSASVAALLRERRAELSDGIAADRRRLHEVEARLRSIEKEIPVSTFIETPLPQLTLTQLSAHIDEMAQIEDEISVMFQRVNEAVDAAGARRVGPGVAVYTTLADGMIAAAAEQIGDAPVPAGLERAVLAAEPRALTLRYEAADLAGIQSAWQALVAEAERRGLRPDGACREIYLQTPYDGGASWVIDLQQPLV
ncbi:MerR family transcriptional regulator [Microbacterium sp. cf332]|uniref:MerR family transcriptional regulator n=1 Tax=Microbacterium sp. cf332 TaxID=1761804 RepID=UPI000882D7F3|nr:MerR family transcriptional regulator [Microbacterium sp. cf332]SDQ66323.1 DNA-binding transcriptional regulator, MerR family [Microbacterium sp. cf332]